MANNSHLSAFAAGLQSLEARRRDPAPSVAAAPSPELMEVERASAAAFAIHDAKNLAAALSANIDWLRTVCADVHLPPETVTAVREMSEVCEQLTRLLVGALGACRAASQTVHVSIHPATVANVVSSALLRIRRRADAAGLRVEAAGPTGLVAPFDVGLMGRVLDNLLDNAIRVSPPAGRIWVEFGVHGGNLLLTVSDDGPGVSEEDRCRVFDMYVKGSTLAGQGGTAGLGLAFCRSVLVEHGGYLDVENRPEGGARFVMLLPMGDYGSWQDANDLDPDGADFAEVPLDEDRLADDLSASLSERSITMIIINSQRFGRIEISRDDVISFPTGIVGFPEDKEFILLRNERSDIIGWLQSVSNPALALPVVSAHCFGDEYPDVSVADAAQNAGLDGDPEQLAVLVVLAALPGQPATVNLLAPIIISADTRTGAQVILEGTRFTTRELFVLPGTRAREVSRPATAQASATP
ncbi:MAG: flagellar assembly protein FliW [Polyangiaceae bacterium]|nr:flagellar assembly protein FliW [Polyangiaceae bacterium]